MVLFNRIEVLIVCLLLLVPSLGRAQDMLRLVTIDGLARTDPQIALAETEAALRDPDMMGTPPDLRILTDLLSLRAELLERLGDLPAAADAWIQVAQTRGFARETLRVDPVPAFERAATLYERAGLPDRALRALEGAVAAEIATGRSGARLAMLHGRRARVADMAGDAEAAARARAALEVLRQPEFESALGQSGAGFVAVDVYYATDRTRSGSDDPAHFYGAGRADQLELGVARVTIPDTHIPGQVERPSVWKLDFRASPSRHILLDAVEPLDPGSFFGRLQTAFRDEGNRDLFVYVHGFNQSWEYAIQRGAQLAHDMGNAAVPVVFSWPSRDSTVGYIADAAVVRLSGRRLARLLEDLVARSGASTIHVLAHSMGSRAVADALEILALKRQARAGDPPIFGQVLFAAPDVDAQLFADQARSFRPLAQRMTLYASSADWALVSSRKLHGEAPRAGMGGRLLVPSGSFDSVDMSALGEDMLMHNYFSNDSSALADMMTLFWTDSPPERRCGLAPRRTRTGTVWEYRDGLCPVSDLMGVMAHLRLRQMRDLAQIRRIVPDLLPGQGRAETVMTVLERLFSDR